LIGEKRRGKDKLGERKGIPPGPRKDSWYLLRNESFPFRGEKQHNLWREGKGRDKEGGKKAEKKVVDAR